MYPDSRRRGLLYSSGLVKIFKASVTNVAPPVQYQMVNLFYRQFFQINRSRCAHPGIQCGLECFIFDDDLCAARHLDRHISRVIRDMWEAPPKDPFCVLGRSIHTAT